MKKLKCFLMGALGTIVVAITLAILIPQYCDYQAAVTSHWQLEFRPLLVAIEKNILKNGTVTGSGVGVTADNQNFSAKSRIAFIKVTDSGMVIIKGENREFMTGQLMLLHPQLISGKVLWTCYAGSERDISRSYCDKNQIRCIKHTSSKV